MIVELAGTSLAGSFNTLLSFNFNDIFQMNHQNNLFVKGGNFIYALVSYNTIKI
jgi:hypothetical protein